MKCIECNAPVVETVEGSYACVSCGSSPISSRSGESRPTTEDAVTTADD
ncbi:hypothetical protein NGM10_07625 [Halorussus salilacus]|nr:hypothetical protein [Halorussus salilacus]USZ69590.1 hypothetical protein NGM10_07625 [Halorussus salilacus]